MGGRARLKQGHAEKIDCEISEVVFHFFKLYRASLSPPPGPDTHIKTPKFAYTFHAWNFPKMQFAWTLSESHVTAHGPLTIGALKYGIPMKSMPQNSATWLSFRYFENYGMLLCVCAYGIFISVIFRVGFWSGGG